MAPKLKQITLNSHTGHPTLGPFGPGENLSNDLKSLRTVRIWPKFFSDDWGRQPQKFSRALTRMMYQKKQWNLLMNGREERMFPPTPRLTSAGEVFKKGIFSEMETSGSGTTDMILAGHASNRKCYLIICSLATLLFYTRVTTAISLRSLLTESFLRNSKPAPSLARY